MKYITWPALAAVWRTVSPPEDTTKGAPFSSRRIRPRHKNKKMIPAVCGSGLLIKQKLSKENYSICFSAGGSGLDIRIRGLSKENYSRRSPASGSGLLNILSYQKGPENYSSRSPASALEYGANQEGPENYSLDPSYSKQIKPIKHKML